jgi:hypothetical protein
MTEQTPNVEAALEGLDQNKRRTLRRLIGISAFVGPVIASFAMQGIASGLRMLRRDQVPMRRSSEIPHVAFMCPAETP